MSAVYLRLNPMLFGVFKMNKHSFDFFPLNRALSLQRRREDDGEHRMETLMAQVQMLVDRMKSEVSLHAFLS